MFIPRVGAVPPRVISRVWLPVPQKAYLRMVLAAGRLSVSRAVQPEKAPTPTVSMSLSVTVPDAVAGAVFP
jgi:hypothetical protein